MLKKNSSLSQRWAWYYDRRKIPEIESGELEGLKGQRTVAYLLHCPAIEFNIPTGPARIYNIGGMEKRKYLVSEHTYVAPPPHS